MASTSGRAFSADEFARRVAATRLAMAQRDVDVLLVDRQEHVVYLTGYAPPPARYQGLLLPLEGDPVMLVRPLDEPKVKAQSWLQSYQLYPDSQEAMTALAALIQSRGWADKRIGLEKDALALSIEQFETLQTLLPGARFVNMAGPLADLRLRKSPEEIALHRKAAQIADVGTMCAIEAVWAGKSPQEALFETTAKILSLGADEGRVGHIRLEQPWPRTSSGVHGDGGRLIDVELVPQVGGYSSRIIRTAILGQASAEQRETARLLYEIHDAQIAAMRPGVPACDVDRICREGILSAGLRPSYDGVTGHTLGYSSVARPTDISRAFLPTSDWLLEPGMVFHMYTRGRGIGLSETVLVTADGSERLTQLDRVLLSL